MALSIETFIAICHSPAAQGHIWFRIVLQTWANLHVWYRIGHPTVKYLDACLVGDFQPLNKPLAKQVGLEVVEADFLNIRSAAREGVGRKGCQDGASNDLLYNICSRRHVLSLAAAAAFLLGLTCTRPTMHSLLLQNTRNQRPSMVMLGPIPAERVVLQYPALGYLTVGQGVQPGECD